MERIQYILSILGVIFAYIIITCIYMRVAACVGEALGIGKLCRFLWQKIRRDE